MSRRGIETKMNYLQPIKFYVIFRPAPNRPHETEIAEHPDGAMKVYERESQALDALELMGPEWSIGDILMVPPSGNGDETIASAGPHETIARLNREINRRNKAAKPGH
jgi:hypothetical protein